MTPGRRGEDGDLHLDEFTVRGTSSGAIALPDGTELPATGRTVDFPGTEVVRARDGKTVEHDTLGDRMSVLEQLGLLPAT